MSWREIRGRGEEFILEKITSAYDAKRKLEDPERLEGLERRRGQRRRRALAGSLDGDG